MFSNFEMFRVGIPSFFLAFVVLALMTAFTRLLFRVWEMPAAFWGLVAVLFALLIGGPLWDWWTADDPTQFVSRFTSSEPLFTKDQLWSLVKFRFWGCVAGAIAGVVGLQIYENWRWR
jgi:ABC-type transporter Mla maintaining outer membrane lipid asymmetry permease subunit MlaE